MAKKGLGKGIDVLIPQAKEKTKSEKENIEAVFALTVRKATVFMVITSVVYLGFQIKKWVR